MPDAPDDSRAREQVVDSKAGGLATYWEPYWGAERSSIRHGDASSEGKSGRAGPSDGAQCVARTSSVGGEPEKQGGDGDRYGSPWPTPEVLRVSQGPAAQEKGIGVDRWPCSEADAPGLGEVQPGPQVVAQEMGIAVLRWPCDGKLTAPHVGQSSGDPPTAA